MAFSTSAWATAAVGAIRMRTRRTTPRSSGSSCASMSAPRPTRSGRRRCGVLGGNAQNLADRTADVAPGGGLSIGSVTSFGEDARGELYVTDHGSGAADGEVFKLVPGS